MKIISLLFLIAGVIVGGACSRDRGSREAPQFSSAVEPDNTGRNVRDRSGRNEDSRRSVRERGRPNDHSKHKKSPHSG